MKFSFSGKYRNYQKYRKYQKYRDIFDIFDILIFSKISWYFLTLSSCVTVQRHVADTSAVMPMCRHMCYGTYRPPRISKYAKEKRKEQNLIVCRGKSEAELTNNRRLRSTYCTTEAKILTDTKHRAASVTVGLFVWPSDADFSPKLYDTGLGLF